MPPGTTQVIPDVVTESPELDDALVDPRRWADEAWVHAQFAWLRDNDPVRWMSPNGFEPFFSVTRHADIKAIESDKNGFVNDPRPILSGKILEAMTLHLAGRRHLVRSLVTMDDPDHLRYRALTQRWFMGSNLRRLAGRIEALAKEYVNRLADLGGECDFVKDVAIWYPLRVIMSVLGVPDADEPRMLKLTQELFGSADPDTQRSFEPESLMDVVADFEAYFRALTQERRARPTEDVASLIANARIDGEPVPELETNGYYILIAHRRPRHHEFLGGRGPAGARRESRRDAQAARGSRSPHGLGGRRGHPLGEPGAPVHAHRHHRLPRWRRGRRRGSGMRAVVRLRKPRRDDHRGSVLVSRRPPPPTTWRSATVRTSVSASTSPEWSWQRYTGNCWRGWIMSN